MNTETMHVERVDLSQLALYKNPRKDLKDIKGLAATIVAAGGILQPLKGFKQEQEGGKVVYLVVDGQRRFTALNLLQEQNEHVELLINVPFMQMPEGMTEAQITAYQILSNEGEPLSPLELGESISEMLASGLKISEVSESLGKSKVYIAELNKLAGLPEYIKALIRKGTLSATLVREQVKAGTLDAFIANINENGVEGENLPSTDITSEINKEVNAGQKNKITASDLQKQNSVMEFKKFSKGFSETFADINKQKTYEFATELVRNLLSYEDILNYFSDEKTAANDTDQKRHLREKANQATGRNKNSDKGLTAIKGGSDTTITEASPTQSATTGDEAQEAGSNIENEAFNKLQSSLFGQAEGSEEITQPLMPEAVEVAAPATEAKKPAAKKVAEAPKKTAPKKAAAKKEAAPKKAAAKKVVAEKTAPSKSTIRKIGYDKQSGKAAE